MTTKEFSDEFDVLVSTRVPGIENFDEYEKSVFLTKAQEQLVTTLYSVVENTEEQRQYLNNLIMTLPIPLEFKTNGTVIGSKPEDLLFILREAASIKTSCGTTDALVVPIKQDHLYKTLKNPFRGPNRYRVIREDNDNSLVLHVRGGTLLTYSITYLRRPSPIILIDLSNSGLSIDKKTDISESELNPILHKRILELAVSLALVSKGAKQ
jgi:hypothetical protein